MSKTIDIKDNLVFVPDFNQGGSNLVTLSELGVLTISSTSLATDISTGGVLISKGGIRVESDSFFKGVSLNGAATNFKITA